MNGNFTQLSFFKSAFASIALFLASFFTVSAQPDYDFRNPVLVSGTDKEEGAVYLFSNVKPGVDAFVTISNITNGITLVELDAGSGYPEALQPTLDTKSKKKGYVELSFQFVHAGTTTPYIQKEIPITCIDVDGSADADGKGHPLKEFDQINMGPGSYVNYSMVGFELDIKRTGDWITGENKGGVEYPGRDTSAKQVMFTVVNANISTAIVRVGVDNATSDLDVQRLRSVYFMKFQYSHALLATSPLRSFNGINKNNTITLTASFASTYGIGNIQVEKAIGSRSFATMVTMNIAEDNNFIFTDNATSVVYYRLKITGLNGVISYSNVLRFAGNETTRQEFKIYPGVTSGNITVNVNAGKPENAAFQLLDLSGRTVYQQPIQLQAGNNAVAVNSLGNMHPGNYIAVVKTGDKVYSQQIVKQ
jgi:hypothetical protein